MTGDRPRRLTVIAHWDPDGEVAPHVARLVESFAAASDLTVVTTTASLTAAGRATILDRAQLVERENHGQDFAGWKQVLDAHLRDGGFDELVLTNDTYVGPLVPVDDLVGTLDRQGVDVWGATETTARGRHLQSFLLGFTSPVIRSRAFTEFWRTLEPAASRDAAIQGQEVGLSHRLLAAGFTVGGYYRLEGEDAELAVRRRTWWAEQLNARDLAEGRPEEAVRSARGGSNPAIAAADTALRGGMPLVKIETLRWDPWLLDSERLLTLCEETFPAEFDGVRDYLDRTARAYPGRPGENTRSHTPPPDVAAAIGYRR